MIRKYNNNTMQTNPRRREEEPQITNSHKTSGDKLSQTISSRFPIKIFAIQERILRKQDPNTGPPQTREKQ